MGIYGHRFDTLIETQNNKFLDSVDVCFENLVIESNFLDSIIITEMVEKPSIRIKKALIAFWKKVKEIINNIVEFFKEKFKAAISKLNSLLSKFKGKNYKQRFEKLKKEAEASEHFGEKLKNQNEPVVVVKESNISKEELNDFLNSEVEIYDYNINIGNNANIREHHVKIMLGDFVKAFDAGYKYNPIDKIDRDNLEDAKRTEFHSMSYFIDKYADNDSLFNLNDHEITKAIDELEAQAKNIDLDIKEIETKDLSTISKYKDLLREDDNEQLVRLKDRQKVIGDTLSLIKELSQLYWKHGRNYLDTKAKLDSFLIKHDISKS